MKSSPVSRLPSPVSRLPSPVSRLPSPVSRLPSPVKNLQRFGNFYALIPRLPRDGVKQLSLDGVIKLTESLINPLGNERNG
ncbi:hypothetical protein D0812_14090 [Vibrio owensii]|uniref:Uncharacterized protein n=1 Tax=Vibrio owensii TaxID=696485 RepID=A0ABN5Q568_9VIBR|nr:hypothetical protein D0812_14090 [Vibrio owensii]